MNFIDELKEYLNSKTKEEILKDWEESSIECDVPFMLTDQAINKTGDIHSVSESYWVIYDSSGKPPIIYGGVVPCFISKKLAIEAKKENAPRGKWKVVKVYFNSF